MNVNKSAARWPGLMCLILCVACLPGCSVPGPEGQADSFGVDFSLPPGATTGGAIVFVVDGVNAEIFDQMLQAGRLPAVKKYFVDRGLYAPRAVTGIPSVTLSNMTTLVTGRFPGHHDIVGNNWFDRNQLILRDLATIRQKNRLDADYLAPNLYEQFPDRTTFSMFLQPHRNATKFFEDRLTAGPAFFMDWFDFVDRLTLFRLNQAMGLARSRKEFPAVTTVYMLAPDFMAYKHGALSAEYRDAIEHTDRQIGRVLGDLERAGLLDKTHIALVSDHGHAQVADTLRMDAFLRLQGLDLAAERLSERTPFEVRMRAYDGHCAVLAGSGERYCALYLRKPVCIDGKPAGWEPWPARPSADDLGHYPVARPSGLFGQPRPGRIDLLRLLTDQPGVDAIAYAALPDAVRVRRNTGEVEFRQEGGAGAPISYRIIAGDDPLGYKGKVSDEALAGAPMTGRQWLAQTLATEFPDLPAQIVAYFRSRRAGDVAIFASPGYDLADHIKSGHGSLRQADMCVPMLLAGPGVPHKTIDVARGADLMPTLLELLGKPIPPGVDGQSLVEK